MPQLGLSRNFKFNAYIQLKFQLNPSEPFENSVLRPPKTSPYLEIKLDFWKTADYRVYISYMIQQNDPYVKSDVLCAALFRKSSLKFYKCQKNATTLTCSVSSCNYGTWQIQMNSRRPHTSIQMTFFRHGFWNGCR